MSHSIRDLQQADVTAVHAIETAVQFDDPWSAKILSDCIRVGYLCRGLFDETTLVGFAVLMEAAGEGHLLNIAIAPQHQGQGLAKVLLRDMIDLCQQRACRRMYLEVRPGNQHAIALYHRFGFIQDGVRPNYYITQDGREDALLYSLMLPTNNH